MNKLQTTNSASAGPRSLSPVKPLTLHHQSFVHSMKFSSNPSVLLSECHNRWPQQRGKAPLRFESFTGAQKGESYTLAVGCNVVTVG